MENEDQNNNNNQKISSNNTKGQSKFYIKPTTEKGFDLNNCFDPKNLKQMEIENGQEETTVKYTKDDDYYFDSYSHFNIHEEMLKDKTRTNAYRNSIIKNKHLFEGKVVLDIGCGTGILSIFAAQAGAKQVIAVDNANIIDFTRKIVEQNGYSDKITILKGKMEEVKLPVDKVDIIISEWMGYFLVYESMLDCVLWARDRYLKKDGLMFPDRAVLYLSAIEDEQYYDEKINFWDNVYGVNMQCIKSCAVKEPLVECVNGNTVVGNDCAILDIDLQTVKVEDLDFAVQYKIKIQRDDYVHAYIAWFDTYFSHCHVPIRLTTSPFTTDTHWKQTIFYLDESLPVNKGDTLTGSIAVKKSEDNDRNIDIKFSCHLKNRSKNFNKSYAYKLN